jgi:ubiquinone/menaquinone biosynthesis C-methylase UbiE
MDYNDYQIGITKEHFWIKAKNNLVGILLKKISLGNDQHILNIGAGTGNDASTLHKFGVVHVVDINQSALDLIPMQYVSEKKCCDACKLPYESNTFDIVTAFDVIEHIVDDHLAVSEIFRVLKPGGMLIFTVPAYQWLFSGHDKYLHHKRRYSKKTIFTLLKNFIPITIGSWMFFLFPCAMFIRLLKKNKTPYSYNEAIHNKYSNFLMYLILKTENWFIKKGLKFPWGLTIYGIFKKPN